MATSISILASGPKGGTRRFSSVRKAARALSGNTSTKAVERTRGQIRTRLTNGGGYIGRTYVETT